MSMTQRSLWELTEAMKRLLVPLCMHHQIESRISLIKRHSTSCIATLFFILELCWYLCGKPAKTHLFWCRCLSVFGIHPPWMWQILTRDLLFAKLQYSLDLAWILKYLHLFLPGVNSDLFLGIQLVWRYSDWEIYSTTYIHNCVSVCVHGQNMS